jgi:hypothetical protein
VGGDACLLRGSEPGGPGLLPPRVLNPSQAFSSCHPGLPPENWEVCRGPPSFPSHNPLPHPPPRRLRSIPSCSRCSIPSPHGCSGHLDPKEELDGRVDWVQATGTPNFPRSFRVSSGLLLYVSSLKRKRNEFKFLSNYFVILTTCQQL